MNLELEERDIKFQEKARSFAIETIGPYAATIDQEKELPRELLGKLSESTILTGFLPQKLGGEGLDLFHLSLLVEETARMSPVVSLLIAQQVVLGIRATQNCLTFNGKEDLAKKAARFELLFSLAATETGSGSDLSQLATKCRRNPDGSFHVEGGKAYVNWAHRSSGIFLLAKVDEPEVQGTTFLYLQKPLRGLSFGPTHATMGLAGLEAAPIEINIHDLPAEALAGVHGFGTDQLERVLNEIRIAFAAISVGIAQQAFDDAAAHAKSRKQFGKPVGSFQSLQWRFAEAATKIEASRLHVWHAVEVAGAKSLSMKQAAIAKIFAAESAFWTTDFAVQVMGSKGFIQGSRVERLFRDSRFLKIGMGTTEILRNLVAATL